MEKSSARIRKFWIGLLILLAQLSGVLCIQKASGAATWQYLQSLRFKKAEKYFFTATDCSFSVNIENITPDKITVAVNDVPQNSSFISMRKETYIPSSNASSDQYGTKIILTFRFNEPGAYQIKAVDVKADIYYCRIPIESVYVYENPSIVHPRIFVTFEDQRYASATPSRSIDASAGDHIRFTLFIRYATQIVDFYWSIPENSLFTEVERFDITRQSVNTTEFSPDSVPIATFDWQPLKQGSYKFPDFTVTAISFGGIRQSVAVPSYKVKVGPKASKPAVKKESEIFSYAFSENPAQTTPEAEVAPIHVDTEELLQLHKKERYSVPFTSSARKERQEAEKKAGLNPSQNEPNIPLLIIIWVIFIVVLAGTVIFFLLHKIPAAATCFVSAIIILISAVIYSRWASTKTAVFKGGEINSIPEDENSSGVFVIPGTVIRIERESGRWVYIRCNDTYGWVRKDSLLEIR